MATKEEDFDTTSTYYNVASTALRSDKVPDPFRFQADPTRIFLNPQQSYIPIRLIHGPNNSSDIPRSILAYHGVGIGKTFVGLQTAATHLRNLKNRGILTDFSKDKPAIIIFVSGAVLKGQWKRQVKRFDKMTNIPLNKYISVLTFQASQAGQDKEDRRSIVTITERMKDSQIDEKLKNTHSHTLFIIDEVQSPNVFENPSKGSTKNGLHLASYLIRVGKLCKNTRLLLLTATPAFDNILPLQRIIELLHEFSMVEIPLKLRRQGWALWKNNVREIQMELSKVARRFVSHVRGENPRVFPVRLAPNPIQTYPSTYEKSKRNDSVNNDEVVRVRLGDNQMRKIYSQRPKQSSPEWRQLLTAVTDGSWTDNLESNSPVMKAIMDAVLKTSKGIVVVSFKYEKSLFAFAHLLNTNGFFRRTGTTLTFTNGENAFKQYIGRQVNSPLSSSLLRLAAEESNRDGKHIRIVLIMPRSATGTDLKNVRQFHIAEPEWSNEALDQVVGRAFRRNSHALLPPEDRNVVVHFYEPYADWNTLGPVVASEMEEYKTGERTREIMAEKRKTTMPLIDSMQKTAFDVALQYQRTIEDYDTAVIRAYPQVIDVFGMERVPRMMGSQIRQSHPDPPNIPLTKDTEPSHADKMILFNNSPTDDTVDTAIDVMVAVFRLYVELSVDQLIYFTRILALTASKARHAAVAYYPQSVMLSAAEKLSNPTTQINVITPSGATAKIRRVPDDTISTTDVLVCVDNTGYAMQRNSVPITESNDWIPVFYNGLESKHSMLLSVFRSEVKTWKTRVPKHCGGYLSVIIEAIIDRMTYIDALQLCTYIIRKTEALTPEDKILQNIILRDGLNVVVEPNLSATYLWDKKHKRPYESSRREITDVTSKQYNYAFLQEGSKLLAFKFKEGKIGQFRDNKLRQRLLAIKEVSELRNKCNKSGAILISEAYWLETALRKGDIPTIKYIRPYEKIIRKP